MNCFLFFMSLLTFSPAYAWISNQSFSNGFLTEKTESALKIIIDTEKKVTGEDIVITHKDNKVLVAIKNLDYTLNFTLSYFPESLHGPSKNTCSLCLCSEKRKSSGDKENNTSEYRFFQGTSCMQQVIEASVDLTAVSAEYKSAQLTLLVPFQPEKESKKIPVFVK